MSAASSLPVTRRRWAWQVGFAAVVLAVVPGLLTGPYGFLFGMMSGAMAEPARVAPCLPGEPVEIMDSPYISQAEAGDVEYNSMPPTSGPHYPYTVATGIYDHRCRTG